MAGSYLPAMILQPRQYWVSIHCASSHAQTPLLDAIDRLAAYGMAGRIVVELHCPSSK